MVDGHCHQRPVRDGAAAPLAVVLKQIMAQFHHGRGEVSLSQSITLVATGITGIFVSRPLHRSGLISFMLRDSVSVLS